MAQETGYEARVMPTAAAPLPMASARTYGGELADTVGQVAQDVHQREIRAYQVRRQQTADQESSDFAHRFALHKQSMDEAVREIRASPTAADYADHVERVAKADDDAREQLLDGITEDSVRRRAAAQLDDFRTRLVGSEGDFAEGQQIAKTRLDAQAVKQLGANRVRRSENGDEFKEELQDWHSYVDGLQRLTPAEKQAIRREGEQEYAVAFVNHLNDTNPALALASLDAGQFDTLLSPQQIDQLRNGSQVEIRRVQAATAEQQRAEITRFRETVATVKSQIERGEDHTAELPGLAAQAEAYGDTSTASDLRGLSETADFMKVWGQRSPLIRQQRIAELQAIPEGKRSSSQSVELKQQLQHKSSLDSAFASDPAEWALTNGAAGNGPPDLGSFSANEVAARAKWVRSAAKSYGSMEPLTKAEAASLGRRAQESDAGLYEVLGNLSAFPIDLARQAVRQALPDNDLAGVLMGLPEVTWRQAVNGRETRKVHPRILDSDDDDETGRINGVRQGAFGALSVLPSRRRAAVIDAANNIAAEALASNGTYEKQMTSAMMARALDAALGATGSGASKKGGLGWWGDKIYLLPNGITQSGFESAINQFIRANPQDLPVNPDGSPIDIRKARPQAIGNDQYRFYVGTRVVTGKDGKPWVRKVFLR
ncbi:hypothetical protein [Novosphingobium sp. ST904]|uniref:hypothetical protein n=1 Tax=Novosphingobium sp. ST904 TaxID=1684385 RepID=UPI0006C8D43C|nr:hypothetical protein [Novosphingobium sp. ST904]KPH66324.1 hypothetical protein ADT71_06555 [Novosphingobium sp. ST904]TCM42096.1 hypothetical protein EDF59_10257 [Novosphingobium sp. ST904]